MIVGLTKTRNRNAALRSNFAASLYNLGSLKSHDYRSQVWWSDLRHSCWSVKASRAVEQE